MSSRRVRSFPRIDSVKALRQELAEAMHEARSDKGEKGEGEREREGPSQLAWLFDRARLWAGASDRPDWTALRRAHEHRERMAAHEGIRRTLALGRWEFVGPNAFDTGGGHYVSGRVNAIALDPRDHETIYAGAAGGGVWKSTDNGITWVSLSDVWPYQEVSSIAVDPTDSSVVYVGTGDYPIGGQHCFGVLKSKDGGGTFAILPVGEAANCPISGIVVDPDDPRILTICGGHGGSSYVWRSTDGGKTWARVINDFGAWSKLVLSKSGTDGLRAMYVCGFNVDLGKGCIYRSLDRGESWIPLSEPHIAAQPDLAIALSPLHPERLYYAGTKDRIVMQSDDRGVSWKDVTFDLRRDDFEWDQSMYDFDLACSVLTDPKARDFLFLGLKHLLVWDSNGTTWSSLPHGHDDLHVLTVDPAHPASRVMIGNDGGVYEQERTGFGWNLNSRNGGLAITQCYRGSASAATANICIAGTQDNAVASSQKDLRAWGQLFPPSGGDAIAALVSPSSDKIQFIEAGVAFHGIGRTADQWKTKTDITPMTGADALDPFSMPMVMDANGKRLYWASDFLWLRDEASGTWTARAGAQKLAGDGNAVRCIAVAASDDMRVFTGSTDGQVWMGDGPDWVWTRIDGGMFKDTVISAIAVHPWNKDNVLICIGGTGTGHVFLCRHTTAVTPKWEDVSGSGSSGLPDVPAVGLVRDGRSPESTWYVALDVGVFFTEVAGTAWKDITVPYGLPNVQLSDLQPIGSDVYVYTFGRGVWRLSPSVNPG